MTNEIIFDVETQKLFNEIDTDDPKDLGVSLVSLYNRTVDDTGRETYGKMHSFFHNELEKMWSLFDNVDRVIGFNSISFDAPILDSLAPFDFQALPHFDILEQVRISTGRRVSLNVLARDTLGLEKNDVGTNAVMYFRKGDPESLEKLRIYCEQDVRITYKIYDYAMQHERLRFKDKWNNMRDAVVDFSYKKDGLSSPSGQLGLF